MNARAAALAIFLKNLLGDEYEKTLHIQTNNIIKSEYLVFASVYKNIHLPILKENNIINLLQLPETIKMIVFDYLDDPRDHHEFDDWHLNNSQSNGQNYTNIEDTEPTGLSSTSSILIDLLLST